jgi:hypothetical protein
VSLAWTEEDAAAAESAHASHEGASKSPMPLPVVGRRQVVVRDAALD